MTKPRTIVWDIDDVLTPTTLTFHQAVARTHGSCLHPDLWSDYLWGQHAGMDEGLETQQYLIDHRIIELAEPFDYTDQALSLTKQAGYKNVLLSARAWHPNPTGATTEWMARYVLDPYIDDMHFTLVHETKQAALEKLCGLYDIVAFVEDNPINALSAIGIVPQIFLVKRGWNANHHDDVALSCVNTALEAAQCIVTLS